MLMYDMTVVPHYYCRIHDLSDARNMVQPSMKLLNLLHRKMQDRKTAYSGGRMLRTIDEWIQTKLDTLDSEENPDEEAGEISLWQQSAAKQFAENQQGGPHTENLEAGTQVELEPQSNALLSRRPSMSKSVVDGEGIRPRFASSSTTAVDAAVMPSPFMRAMSRTGPKVPSLVLGEA